MRKYFAAILTAMLVVGMMPGAVYAADVSEDEVLTEENALTPGREQVPSNNLHWHTYYGSWIDRPYSFLTEEDDGYMRVEYVIDNEDNRVKSDGKIVIEYYSKEFNFLRGYTTPRELEKFGGFYKGKDAYYLVFGQDNPNDDPSKEVVRVVKYDFNWNRKGAASFYGINTSDPFGASNVSMAEYGNFLYVHTGHGMFAIEDGLKHQASLTLSVDTRNMKAFSSGHEISYSNFIYVSHSFNQYITVDGDDVIVIDHGDASPRGIELGFSNKLVSEGYVCGNDYPADLSDPDSWDPWYNNDYKRADIFKGTGDYGDNYTGINVGGLEYSSDYYITALSHVTLNDSFKANTDWNISLLLTPKSYLRKGVMRDEEMANTKEIRLTTDGGNGKQYDNPYLVKVNGGLFIVMWEVIENNGYTGKFQAVAINGNGQKVSDITTFEGGLSDCKPICVDGKIVWYTTGGGRFWSKLIWNKDRGDFGYIEAPRHGGPTDPQFFTLTPSKAGNRYILSLSGAGTVSGEATMDFVSRFYTTILGREAEEGGLNNWTSKLINKEQTGAEVAAGFIRSPEFTNQGNSDSAYVKKLYRAFFDREPDIGGYNQWMSRLATGADRDAVLAGFINSDEFANLCSRYGIEKGTLDATGLPCGDDSKVGQFMLVDSSGVDVNKLNEYVERLYTKILGRSGETKGMEYWRGEILSGNKYDAATAARTGFFTSAEYLAKNKSDDEFIRDAYAAFFNRDPDPSGYAYWKEQLANGGYDRDSMIDVGFGHSTEFKNLLKTYGFKITE